MILFNLPFADVSDIEQNFQHVGEATGFTLQQFLAQVFAFTILCVVMYFFAWKKVLVILEERRRTIEQSLANADKIKKELSDAEATRLSIIQKANEQANRIIAEAEKSAAAVTEARAKDATRQAEDIVKSAREASVLERNRMMDEAKRQLGALVVQTAEKVVGKVINADDQARLNGETLRRFEASNN